MNDVLVVGEALVDVVQRPDGTSDEYPGGSPANVALGLARLGRDVALLSRIGSDERGDAVRRHLQASGVRLAPGTVTDARTSTATARLDERGVADYSFDLDWSLPAQVDLGGAVALHVGSIAAFLEPGARDVRALVEQASGRLTVSYDPNARPVLMGEPVAARRRVEGLVALADVVKVSDEDLEWLAPGEDPEQVTAAWLAGGPSVVVLTRGGEGATALSAAGRVSVRAPRIQVVDTVGAGDSFMAALLDHLAGAGLLGPGAREELRAVGTATLEELLLHAVRVAAVTCTRPGADPPTRTELASMAF